MKHSLFVLLALTITLAACAPVTPAAPTATTAPTATSAPTATNTPSPTATEATTAPTMESLPAEWQDKVSGIETLSDGRIVALEKLTDAQIAAGLKPQLRELQWGAASNEWIPYVPKVGLIDINSEYWDKTLLDGQSIASDEMTGPELQQITAEPIYGKDGQEIKPGLVADFIDATVFCGDIVEVHKYKSGSGTMVIRVPQATGDLELFYVPYVVNYGEGVINYAYDRDSIDPSTLVNPFTYQDQPMGQVITEYPMGSTPTLGKAYQEGLADVAPVRVVFAISKTAPSAGGADSPEARRKVIGSWTGEDVFNASGVKVILDNPAMIPESEYQP